MLNVKKLERVRGRLTSFVEEAKDKLSSDELIKGVMAMRGYEDSRMFDVLKEVGIFRIDDTDLLPYIFPKYTWDDYRSFGFLTKKFTGLLDGRYCIPIRDIGGNVAAVVGWLPDKKKYLTSPTYGFSRDTIFFNMETYQTNTDGLVYLVEGIFDALALRSLGLTAYGCMGLELTKVKSLMLNRYRKVIAIPDNDTAGLKVSPYTNKLVGGSKKFVWDFTIPYVFVLLPEGIKDCDDLIRDYDCLEDLQNCSNYSLRCKIHLE